MENLTVSEIEYYISIEQDIGKKLSMQACLSGYLNFQRENIKLNQQIKEMEEALNKGQVNPILMKEHQELQEKYNKLEERMSKIYILASE